MRVNPPAPGHARTVDSNKGTKKVDNKRLSSHYSFHGKVSIFLPSKDFFLCVRRIDSFGVRFGDDKLNPAPRKE